MCSILGGTKFGVTALHIFQEAKDRGRDFTGLCAYGDFWICNHRATPTNELENPVGNQPFGSTFKVVHNGTVANDKELGVPDGEIDSKAFEYVLKDCTTVGQIAGALEKIKGSYALAIMRPGEIILACNYKPIWWVQEDGEIYFSSLRAHFPKHLHPIRVPAYSVLNLQTQEAAEIKRLQYNRALIVCSGGLDSTSICGYAKSKHHEILLLHFDYGCRATKKEIEAIENIAQSLGCQYEVIEIDYTKMRESTLFGDKEITTGKSGVEYALDWVPARNLLLLGNAVAYAEANKFGHIYLGSNLEEAGAYPDNEEQFILDFNNLLCNAVNEGLKIEIHSPLGGLMKREIVLFGIKHSSPIELSWSCYNSGEYHCGKCGPCYMRKEAFNRAGVTDPTKYEV